MMTLDEAIAHAKEVAEENREVAELISNRPLEVCDIHRKEDKCLECAKEHEQLAEWLKDYKRLLEMPKGDLISREALKNEVKGLFCPDGYKLDFIRTIDNAPTVTPKQGEWKTFEGYDGDEYYECSNCGEPWFLETGTPKDNNMNFCPNCGADMKGDKK